MTSPIRPIAPALPEIVPAPGLGQRGSGFQNVLEGAIGRVEQLRTQAGQSVERFLSGESEELHGTILETQRAELAFELFLQVRNKVVQAYQEVMRMQM